MSTSNDSRTYKTAITEAFESHNISSILTVNLKWKMANMQISKKDSVRRYHLFDYEISS